MAATPTAASSRVRPVSASNNIYNLADFMLGLRSQYALSNVLVAHLRQDMHFVYVQDDFRVNDTLTLNLGLRYEYATPIYWERDNVLTNFDPATLTMVAAKDGSISDRALVNPDRNNFGPRLGFAWTPMAKTVVRGGYGIGYVHYNRAGGGNLLPINGPQVVNAVVNQTNPTRSGIRADQAGLSRPGSPIRKQFNPLTANITYMPTDIQDGRVQNWYLSVQREIGAADARRRRVRRQSRRQPAAVRQHQPGGAEQRRRHAVAAVAASDSDVRRHHVCVRRRQLRIPRAADQVRMADAGRRLAADRVHVVARHGQRRGVARERKRQLPRAAGLQQPGRGVGHVGLRPAVQQHDEPRLGPAVRPWAQVVGGGVSATDGRADRRMAAGRASTR